MKKIKEDLLSIKRNINSNSGKLNFHYSDIYNFLDVLDKIKLIY